MSPYPGHDFPATSDDNDDFIDVIDVHKPLGCLKWEDEHGQVDEVFINYGDQLIIGREPDPVPWSKSGPGEIVTIPITDNAVCPFISRSHFRIYPIIFDKSKPSVRPMIYCEDLESKNGTYVNGFCIGTIGREMIGHLLCHGDLIEVHPHWRFRFYQLSGCHTSKAPGHPEDIAYFQDLYTVSDRMLGSGQYGKVFLATEVATFKQTVCKISDLANAVDRPSQSSETSPNITRSNALSVEEKGKLKREMWILSKLDHPHIVNMRKAFYSENTMYMFTDLAPGGDLFSYIDFHDGTLTDWQIRIIARQLVLAVKYLHSRGIVHRDIKPENVLIMHTGHGGRVVLTDFGFAIDARPNAGRMLSKLGTRIYCAPEVELVESSKDGYTASIDLYSLGVSIFCLLTGGSILPRSESSQVSPQKMGELLRDFEEGARTEAGAELSSRVVRFLRRLVDAEPARRMTAKEALEHSWMINPPTEAAAIKDCCEKIIRFWKKRDSDDVVIRLPEAHRSQVDETSRKESRFKRKIPDTSMSPYFNLERHLNPREVSQRRNVLERLLKTRSQFVATADEQKTSRVRMKVTNGSDIFGKSPDTQVEEELGVEDEVSLVTTVSPRVRAEIPFGFNLSDAPSLSKADQVSVDSEKGLKDTSRKRTRLDSEDAEEKRLRDDVARGGPKWQSARALKEAVAKRKIEVGQHVGKKEPAFPALAVRSTRTRSA